MRMHARMHTHTHTHTHNVCVCVCVCVCVLRSKIENAHWAEKRPQRVVALEKQQ